MYKIKQNNNITILTQSSILFSFKHLIQVPYISGSPWFLISIYKHTTVQSQKCQYIFGHCIKKPLHRKYTPIYWETFTFLSYYCLVFFKMRREIRLSSTDYDIVICWQHFFTYCMAIEDMLTVQHATQPITQLYYCEQGSRQKFWGNLAAKIAKFSVLGHYSLFKLFEALKDNIRLGIAEI